MLSVIFTYYNNPGMLAKQYGIWRGYPNELELIVIDDCSRDAAIDVPRPEGIKPQIYRMAVDRPWNQDAARNLGAHVASGKWLLFLDIDHTISAQALGQLIAHLPLLQNETAYRFARQLVSGKKLSVAPNIWLMRRVDFWRMGGYDERLCGSYGTDRDFVRRVASKMPIENLLLTLSVYTGKTVADAATRGLDRTVVPLPNPHLPEPVLALGCQWERQL